MPKLHQILAIESGTRTQTQKDITAAHHGLQKREMLQGIERKYQPLNEDGELLPPERTLLQTRVPEVIQQTVAIWQKVYDIIATRDFANLEARADVVVGSNVILKDVPATHLLWLEKKLADVHTFVCKLPILPADTEWKWDETQQCYRNAQEIKTVRTQKIAYPLVLSPATKEHPAQVEKEFKDEIVGHWITHKFSGAIKRTQVTEMKERVEELQKAVKFAREQANAVEVKNKEVGKAILSFVFDNMKKEAKA